MNNAKNSPILLVPSSKGPCIKSCFLVFVSTPRYSIIPGFPLEAASTEIEL